MMHQREQTGLAMLAAMILSFASLAGTLSLMELASADRSAVVSDIRLA